ncbi:hypothetical protein XA68_10063 [Ophiocordyceps unilateralis]|uniref:G-patch domain-containing protein n=1 Tax=Ophiocordyceps unilateralis TaxID=268505 RepID=A0A2A9PUY6_OPHUN|nr:hypothetical protein XA68_10063 [Ophiocordyceps unilateralis]
MRRARDKNDEEEVDDEDIPLHRKKPFGAGLKRKRVEFVPATEADGDAVATTTTASSAADLYASVVLGGREPERLSTSEKQPEMCVVCSIPITTSSQQHALSLAHQVSLVHTHPPSALDRSRMGLRTLQSHGWDPDARRGLGLHGEGARFPLKTKAKHDNRGVGAAAQAKPEPQQPATKEQRKREAEAQRLRTAQLQAELYSRIDVEGYLRGDGADQEP